MNQQEHWDKVYGGRPAAEHSWFQATPGPSLDLIRDCTLEKGARILDVGAGASLLPSFLLEEGYRRLSVLDASTKALALAKAQLGSRAVEVEWFQSDILDFEPPHRWDLWHDRAVFHFLTSRDEQAGYSRVLSRALEPGGHVIIGCFALDGPSRCSGLDVVRHSPESVGEVLGEEYRPSGVVREAHETPSGASQNFVFVRFQRRLEP